jgi:hypothetical protein
MEAPSITPFVIDDAPPPWGDERSSRLRIAASNNEAMYHLVDDMVADDSAIAVAMAARAKSIDRARCWSETTMLEMGSDASPVRPWSQGAVARRSLVMEIAAALRLPERTAENLIEESRLLLHSLPLTYEALKTGSISYRHAQTIVDHVTSLPEGMWSLFESRVLVFAESLTVAKFDRKARLARELLHEESIDTRALEAAQKRQVSIEPARDGMAWLTALLPAAQAHAVFNRLTEIAGSLAQPTDERTLTQLRADVLVDLLVDGTVDGEDHADSGSTNSTGATGHGIRARVMVTVPVLSLLGKSDEPAMLEGYGPIDLETARILAADATGFVRILTHPETGAILSVGRGRYAPPADLRAWLRMRDETCRAVGCNAAASSCDVDHTDDWQNGGHTAHDNLEHLCPRHHDSKHHTDWTLAQIGDGTLRWTAPSGHSYVTEPANRIKPAA